MKRALPVPPTDKVRMSLWLPKELYDGIKKQAHVTDTSMTVIMVQALSMLYPRND